MCIAYIYIKRTEQLEVKFDWVKNGNKVFIWLIAVPRTRQFHELLGFQHNPVFKSLTSVISQDSIN